MWLKGTMHEGSAGTPMILASPDVPQGREGIEIMEEKSVICKAQISLDS